MTEQDRSVLAQFETVWARVQPGRAASPAAASEPDDVRTLRAMIDQTDAASRALTALSQREPCRAAVLRRLSCERKLMARQLQGAFYLLTGERHAPGASCAVRHESAACLRCLWLAGRRQAAQARQAADTTDEPLLRELYAELAALLDAQGEVLAKLICTLLD